MCCCSLRSCTYFWVFTHILFGVVLIAVIGYENLASDFTEESIRNPKVYTTEDTILDTLLWLYGVIYLFLGIVLLYGVDREYVNLLKWMVALYILIQCASIVLNIYKFNQHFAENTTDDNVLHYFTQALCTNLVVFFLFVEFIQTFFYSVCLALYTYRLSVSNVKIQQVNYI